MFRASVRTLHPSPSSRHWELGRLALVDRNILRLAAWELLTKKAPHAVIISEATRLAQEFSTVDSPRFVNGVLDAVTKELSRDTEDNGKSKDEKPIEGQEL